MREMKDSGVQWIGEIPRDWNSCKLINVLRCKIMDGPHETPNLVSDGIPFISVDSLNDSDRIDFTKVKKFISEELYNEYSKKAFIEPGDILFTKAATIGKTAIVGKEKFMVWSPLAIIKCNENVFNKFLYYVLGTKEIITAISLSGTHNTQTNVGMRTLESTYIPITSLTNQIAIATYLDTKTFRIDTLITNQKAQIEKLKAYKQSLISQTVTKGLDPNAKMKDSGVDWIGEISDSHIVYKLKHLLNAQMQYGANEAGDKYTDNSVRYIRITDIALDGKLKNDENNQYLLTEIARNYILKDKDVLFARSGATVGKSFLYRNEYGLSAFAGYLIKAECNQAKLLPEYLLYFTQSSLYELWKNMIFIQSTIQNIGANKYSNMELPVPYLYEQQQIVSYLDTKCSQIDSLIALKEEKIEMLERYKKSLIYEYVTGKKEVV